MNNENFLIIIIFSFIPLLKTIFSSYEMITKYSYAFLELGFVLKYKTTKYWVQRYFNNLQLGNL